MRRRKFPFKDIIKEQVASLNGAVTDEAKAELSAILDVVPIAYNKVPAIFRNVEKKKPGEGGLFSIFVSDLCKGCGECVEQCGDHGALVMVPDTEELNQDAHRRANLQPSPAQTPRRNTSASTTTMRQKIPARPRCAITSWCAATTRPWSPAMAPAPAVVKNRSCAPPHR